MFEGTVPMVFLVEVESRSRTDASFWLVGIKAAKNAKVAKRFGF